MTRKAFFLLTILQIFANLSQGQEFEFTIGPGISKYNLRQVNFPTYVSQFEIFKLKPTPSGLMGIDLKLNISDNLHSKIGLNYSLKGTREYTVYNSFIYDHPDSTVKMLSDAIWYLHYLDIPITVHFHKFYSFVGGQVSYLWRVNSRYHSEDTYSYNGQVYETNSQKGSSVFPLDAIPYFNRIDFGMIIGCEYPLNQRTQIALRYYQGVRGILDADFFINYRNSQLILAISYNLTRKKDAK